MSDVSENSETLINNIHFNVPNGDEVYDSDSNDDNTITLDPHEIKEETVRTKMSNVSDNSIVMNNNDFNFSNGDEVDDNDDSNDKAIFDKFEEESYKTKDAVVKLELIDIYPCKICHSAFLSFLELGNHIIMEHMDGAVVPLINLKIHTCDICNSSFPNSIDYQIHLSKHRKLDVKKYCLSYTNVTNSAKYIKRYECPDCDYKFALESTLAAHKVVHQRGHTCHCGVRYYRRRDLVAHSFLVHGTTKPVLLNTASKPKIKKQTEQENSDPNSRKTKITKFDLDISSKSEIKRAIKTLQQNEYNRYPCLFCDKTFSGKANVEKHVLIHTGHRPYACHLCTMTFNQHGALKIHLKRHTGVRDIVCTECNKGFFDKGALNLHIRTHTGFKPYKCKYCPKKFSDPSAFVRHTRTHTGDKPYHCKQCPMWFSDPSGLIAHEKRHAKQKNITCPICDKKLYNNTELQRHLATHSKIKTLKCNICDRSFKLNIYLTNHMSRVHGNNPRLVCDYCGKTYPCKADIKKHIKEHMYQVYKCGRCRLKFFSRTKFMNHKQDCVNIEYECEFCGKAIYNKYSYKDHITRVHTVSNWCFCDYCGKQFNEKRSLPGHILARHTKVKHKCKCGKIFNAKHWLREHKSACLKK